MEDVDKIIKWLARRRKNADRTYVRKLDSYYQGRADEAHNILHAIKQGHWKTGEWMTAEDVERRSWRAAAAPWFEDVQVL